MKFDKSSMLLYAVTDRSWLNGASLIKQVENAILGGATFVQLREKDITDADFISDARKIKRITDHYHIPYVINDNIRVAMEADADGVHVGQSDMEAGKVRETIGEDKILGVSVQTIEQAKLAEAQGADYLGVGAVFSTSTKSDAQDVSFATLKQICDNVSIPVVAIGGISECNVSELSGSGIAGIAVVSALFAQKDIRSAAERLQKLITKVVDTCG